MLVLYPYKNALWALRPAKPLCVLSRHPCRNPKPLPRGEGLCMLGWLCVLQSLAAYTPGIRAGAILLGLPPLDQARMLAVSHTKPLHDAVAQMADDLYGGYAPNPIFKKIYRFFDRLRSRTVARDRNLFISSHCKSAFRRHSLPSAYCRVLHHRLSAFLR